MKYFALSLLSLCFLWGCADTITNHGWIGEEESFSKLQVGSTNREAVEKLLGPATFVSAFDDSVLYYISAQTAQGVSFLRPRLLNYMAYGLTLDKRGTLKELHGVSQADCTDLSPSSKETPIKKSDRSLFVRGISNFGRLSS